MTIFYLQSAYSHSPELVQCEDLLFYLYYMGRPTASFGCKWTVSNIYVPVFVHYRVLVHEGNEVFVEGGIRIMDEPKPKASALSAW